MTKIKVGVVGLGEVAQVVHFPILQAYFDQFEIAAICDISQELLSALGERYNVPARTPLYRLYGDGRTKRSRRGPGVE